MELEMAAGSFLYIHVESINEIQSYATYGQSKYKCEVWEQKIYLIVSRLESPLEMRSKSDQIVSPLQEILRLKKWLCDQPV